MSIEVVRRDHNATFYDRISVRCVEHARAYPKAVDLEASCLHAAHAVLHGVASLLRGNHSPRHWRQALMGERHFRLSDLCRLATDPTREGGEAADAILRRLAAARGCRVVPDEAPIVDALEIVAGASETRAAVVSELLRDVRDGSFTAEEARGLRPEIEADKARIAQVESLCNEAERVGVVRIVGVGR